MDEAFAPKLSGTGESTEQEPKFRYYIDMSAMDPAVETGRYDEAARKFSGDERYVACEDLKSRINQVFPGAADIAEGGMDIIVRQSQRPAVDGILRDFPVDPDAVEVTELHDTPNWAVVIKWQSDTVVNGDLIGPHFSAQIEKGGRTLEIIGNTAKEVADKVRAADPKAKFNSEESDDPTSEETADDFLKRLREKS